jgi:SAM-dependent methyltransferase
MPLNMKINNIIKKIYYEYLSKYLNGKVKIFNRHSSYEDYIKKQKEKTLDPKKILKWKGVEWQIKVDGFENLFKRNEEYITNKKKALCLGSRTGQEVFVLRKLGMDAIGIDLVEFPPYTIKGDIHNITYEDGIFDLVFTNILDHSLYLQKFVSEMERVSTKGGIIILNIQENIPIDDYSENIIHDTKPIIELFKNSVLLKNRRIKNTFDSMNRELIFEKN